MVNKQTKRFIFEEQDIPGVILVIPKAYSDNRGSFMESYRQSEFIEGGIPQPFVQSSLSHSKKHVLRGMHYSCGDIENQMGKLVTCVHGKILDVAVDLRKESLTYRKYVMVELSEDNKKMLYVPRGFAHGLLTLDNINVVYYLHDCEYDPKCDAGVRWNDPAFNISWPKIEDLIISEKDKNWPLIKT